MNAWRSFLALAALLAMASLIYSPSTPAAGNGENPVRVGIYQNAPKIYRDDDGIPRGLFVTLIQEIARQESWQLAFIDCAWQTCLEQLRNHQIDLLPDMAYSEERNQRFAFHQVPVTHSWSVILTPRERHIFSVQALDGERIALLAGAVQIGALDTIMSAYRTHYTPVTYPDYATAFAAVQDGEAAAVVSNSFFAGFFAQQYGLRESPVVFNPVALYYATPKGDPRNLLPRIDAHLEDWRYDEQSVYYQALNAAMVPLQEPVMPRAIRGLLIGIAIVLPVFLVIHALLRWQVRRKTAELQETAHRLDHMLGSSPVVLYQLTLSDGDITTRWVSDNISRLFGFSANSFITENRWPRQLHPDDREALLNNLALLPGKNHLVQEYRILDADGNTRFVRDEMQLLPGSAGQPDEVVGSWNDLTESHEQAAKLSFLTHYDPLTRLPNRLLLHERLSLAIFRAQREQRPLAVLFIDIDRFKTINESLGHAAGDTVLKAVASRLSQLLHSGDILARVGGNGFVMLLEDTSGRRDSLNRAQQIMQSFVEPIALPEQELTLTLSIGISLYPGDGSDADSLLQHAEAAMYDAKRAGRNVHRLYSASLSAGQEDRLLLEHDLRSAAGNNQLLLYYQPQIDLNSGRLVGVEALVRWQHPERGLVSPGQFIPIAEEMGIIGEIGTWVLEEACRQMTAWQSQDIVIPCVAVNLSVQQIDDETLVPLVRDVLDRTGLRPSCLELEVTESIIMRDPDLATTALKGFRDMGIQLAIDDFGTGYSSLNYLKHLPINRLKIDQSFVRDIGTDSNSEAISRAIIGLARSLELETVAEGIEQQHQLDFLRREGCPVGQGYLFSRPQPAERLPDIIRTLQQWRNPAAP